MKIKIREGIKSKSKITTARSGLTLTPYPVLTPVPDLKPTPDLTLLLLELSHSPVMR